MEEWFETELEIFLIIIGRANVEPKFLGNVGVEGVANDIAASQVIAISFSALPWVNQSPFLSHRMPGGSKSIAYARL